MILGMTESELQEFIERIAATTIANRAILRCYLREVPLKTENVLRFVDDFADPTTSEFGGLVAKIEAAIVEVVEKPWPVFAEGPPIN